MVEFRPGAVAARQEWFRRHWQDGIAFNRLCGFAAADFIPDVVRIRAAFRPGLSAHEKIFHGGVLATLIGTRRGRSLNFAQVVVINESGKRLADGRLTVNISGRRTSAP